MAEIIKECDNCKHVMTDMESFPCNRCKRNTVDKWEPMPKKTNADKIRSMSDEELAEYLYKMALASLTIVEVDSREIAIPKLLNWLQSEAE